MRLIERGQTGLEPVVFSTFSNYFLSSFLRRIVTDACITFNSSGFILFFLVSLFISFVFGEDGEKKAG